MKPKKNLFLIPCLQSAGKWIQKTTPLISFCLLFITSPVCIGQSEKNLLKSTEQFDDPAWEAFSRDVEVTDGATEAPDGTMTASRLAIKGYVGQIIKNATAGRTYLLSVWAKSATENTQYLSLGIENNRPAEVMEFKKFLVDPWEWTQCHIAAECPAEGNMTFRVSFRNADVYLWHPQLEEADGDPNQLPSDYIPGKPSVRPKVVMPPESSDYGDASKNISCWGDSLTQGAGGTPWPEVIEKRLPGTTVNNFGIGGQKSDEIKARFLNNPESWSDITVIWSGRNNYSDPEGVLSDIATMVSKLKTRRFVVLGVINGESETKEGNLLRNILRINNSLSKMYPDNYLDIREILVSSPAANQPTDEADRQKDVPPGSLRSDKLHLNSTGYEVVAQAIADFLKQKMWVPTDAK